MVGDLEFVFDNFIIVLFNYVFFEKSLLKGLIYF